jgi:putative transposase
MQASGTSADAYLVSGMGQRVRHYNEYRPHQGREQRPPALEMSTALVTDLATLRIRRRRVLNGMINEDSQAA